MSSFVLSQSVRNRRQALHTSAIHSFINSIMVVVVVVECSNSLVLLSVAAVIMVIVMCTCQSALYLGRIQDTKDIAVVSCIASFVC